MLVAYTVAIVRGTMGSNAPLKMWAGMGNGFLKLVKGASATGGGSEGGAASGGNLKTAHLGNSPG